MNKLAVGMCIFASVALISACGSSSPAQTNSTPSTGASPSSSRSSVAVTLDPCQVVTASEASSLTGATYTTGKEDTTSDGNGKLCFYGAQTLDVFEVLVTQARDAATAQADWSAEEARVQASLSKGFSQASAGVNVNLNDTSVSGAGKAAVVTSSGSLNGMTFNISGIYLLKGAVFLAIVDIAVNKAAPTASALESEAQTALGRLP